MKYPIEQQRLPIEQLERLGLYTDGTIYLDPTNLDALLAGRRTDMLSITNLELDGLQIRQLDAKLSLHQKKDGSISLNIHPVYKKAMEHPLLSVDEMDDLILGKTNVIIKTSPLNNKKNKEVAIEYDEQTREFVVYYPEQVQAPIIVNGQRLSAEQRVSFQKGNTVELEDGTRFQHSAVDSKGIRSDSLRLILLLRESPESTAVIFRNLPNLKGNGTQQIQGFSKGYNRAVSEMLVDQLPKNELSVEDYFRNQNRYSNLYVGEKRTDKR